jgi:hypothetical protein
MDNAAESASNASKSAHRDKDMTGRADKGPALHSRYGDGTPVYKGQQPPGISGPDAEAEGPHTVLRWDTSNNRIYQGREFDAMGNPVRDIDFTNLTYPNGKSRPGADGKPHPGPPHLHQWYVNDPKLGPRSGFKRGKPSPIEKQ